MDQIEIYVDGSADNAKKLAPSYTAVWMPGRAAQIQKCQAVTNNEAEYLAVMAGIALAQVSIGRGKITIVSDSQLVVNQLKLEWKCKEPRMAVLRDEALRAAGADPKLRFEYRWCRRDVNQAGIEMDNFLRRQGRR